MGETPGLSSCRVQTELAGWVSGSSLPQTLESQLAAVRKGRKINEDEIPPPVALGKRPPAAQETTNRSPEADRPAPPTMEPGMWRQSFCPSLQGQSPWPASPSCHCQLPSANQTYGCGDPRYAPSSLPLMPLLWVFCLSIDHLSQPETCLLGSPGISAPPDSDPQSLLLARQREYKVAALNAKRAGDLGRARELMRIGKV